MDDFRQFGLHGKTALVTGCSAGIGKAIAHALAAAGADIIGASRSLGENNNLENQIHSLGKKFTGISVDLTDRNEVYRLIDAAQNIAQIDILVNNAGMILRKPAAEHDDEYWDKVTSLNLDAQFILARELGKKMVGRGAGKIVFICSMLSYQGGINVPSYTASKSAVAGLVKAFANEWAAKGVNVNGIAPGYIATDNTLALRNDPVRSKAILDRIPAGRWGLPEDITGPVVFLCSEMAAYIHGTILNVDGGWMAR
jgi:2-deoxy-D-gluconate 3-dehydrogenase